MGFLSCTAGRCIEIERRREHLILLKLKKGYEFDDVLIMPIPSAVGSRDDVDISVHLSKSVKLDFPLLASPMVGVSDGAFAKKLSDLGGLAILHRFYKTRKHLIADIRKNLSFDREDGDIFGLSIGINDTNFEELLEYNPTMIVVDTANGYNIRVLKYCEKIKNYIKSNNYNTLLMGGNVVTRIGCQNLRDSGCDIIRVGIGGGSPCSTRNQTGVGIPNLTALMESFSVSDDYKIAIDGGIRAAGDLVKSIIAGADVGISGKLYAECYEAPNEGILSGMSSRAHMENSKIAIKSIEGFDTKIVKKHSLGDFIREFGYGIKSAGTYLNAKNLSEIHANGRFIEVSDTAIKKNI